MREREIVFRAIPPERDAKADEILSVARQTNAVVKRIDARDVKRGKRQAEIDRQERCFGYWEIGRQKLSVKLGTNSKATHKDVFAYFKDELKDVGVITDRQFGLLLTHRSKRLSRSRDK